MKISVAVCTWNRSALLQRTLESVCAATPPTAPQWEAIVVNNNSTDRTEEIIASFKGRLPIVPIS